MKTLFATAILAASLACSHAPAHTARGRLAEWNEQHPEAARELCGWSSLHPRASDEILFWVAYNAPRAQELVSWAQANPDVPVDAFLEQHPGYDGLRSVSVRHAAAMREWLDWTRRHPDAARALTARPGAVRYAARRNAC